MLTISAMVPLSLFFTGPMDMARNIDGPGQVMLTGKSIHLDTSLIPGWWTRFDLILRHESIHGLGDLRAEVQPKKTGERPIRYNKEKTIFRLQTNTSPPPGVTIFNPTNQALVIQKYSLRNYSAINTGTPRLAILLTPYPVPPLPVRTSILLTLIVSFLPIPGLILFWYRGVRRLNQWQLWVPIFFPWIIMILAGALLLGSRHLLLSWETLLITCLPGYLLLALTSRLFQEKLFVPMIVSLIVVNFGILIGTTLGVGLPLNLFVLGLIYQPQFIITAEYAGMAYLFLAFLLYWKRKDWFSPNKHLFRSSILLIFLPCLIIYLANGYSIWGGDTTYNSLLPWRIIQGEGFSFSKEYVIQHGSWGLIQVGDYFAPVFPIGPAFLGIPTTLINYLLTPTPMFSAIGWNQKVTAVWVTALSAAIMFQLIYLVSRKRWLSLLLASGFAFGTTQITISAAALWQHGPAVLLICVGIFFLVRGQQGDPRFFPLAALPLAFLPVMRTQTVLFYLAGLASVALLQPKMILRFFLWSLPGISLTLWVNLGLYHSLLGGYGYQASGNDFATPLLEGVMGSLFSPNRGLLVFSPFLILGIIGGGILWVKRSVIAISFGLAAVLFFLVHAKYGHWHGGYCVAPRFASEVVPILVFFSIYWFVEFKKPWTRLVGWTLTFISIAITLPGFFFIHEQGQWNVFPDVDYYRNERIWDYCDWLPIHFRHYFGLVHFKETPAYPFVIIGSPEPLKSKMHHYRVKVNLEKTPLEVVKLTNIPLKKGSYQIVFKGDAENSTKAIADFIIGFTGHKIEERSLPIEKKPSFTLSHIIKVEKPVSVDVRLKVSGQGALIFDTIQIFPKTIRSKGQ
ncbi:MAG: hypothetical protein A2Y79_12845 [Deltaproteobacteria bacterium RBG_13_43_22]|nr:MAG: hypothetical protein A2Y79_12845 [Deltaproteobacteria bacterium RBG_13_43_22]